MSCWASFWIPLECCLNLFLSLLLSHSSATFHPCKKNGERGGAKGKIHYFDLGLVTFPCILIIISSWLEYLQCRRTNRGRLEELYCERDISICGRWVQRLYGSIRYQNRRAIWWKARVNSEMRNSSRGLLIAYSCLFVFSVKTAALPIYLTLWYVTSTSRICRLNGNRIFLEER